MGTLCFHTHTGLLFFGEEIFLVVSVCIMGKHGYIVFSHIQVYSVLKKKYF